MEKFTIDELEAMTKTELLEHVIYIRNTMNVFIKNLRKEIEESPKER